MQKKEVTILIIDDEPSVGKAIKEVLDKDGFSTILYTHPEHIFSTIKLRQIHVFIIDCMLPKMSGVEVARKIRENIPNAIFIFMSGIYQDKSFIKDTFQKTGAKYFLEKPFSLERVLEIVNEAVGDLVEQEGEPLDELLFSSSATPNEKMDAINKTASVHGFDLPRIFTLLMTPAVNGILHVTSPKKERSSIHFMNGGIVRVDINDPKSYFGALLIDKNYITPEEIELVLTQKTTKKLGERLVDANLISPHVIGLINTEQLGLRLSRLVQNTSYEMKFEKVETKEGETKIDRNILYRFISEWLSSKLTTEWLKSIYLPFMDKRIVKAAYYSDISPIYNLYPMNKAQKFTQIALGNVSIEQIFAKNQWDDETVLKCFHFLVVSESIAFDKENNAKDENSHRLRLQKIKKDMEFQNHFEILGLDNKAKVKEIKKNYYELSKIFHPDKLNPNASSEIKELTNFIFAKISKAYEILGNDTAKENYLKELEHGEAEKILESESLFDEGKSLLGSNQTAKALALFEKAMGLRPPTSEMRLYHLWAKVLTPAENMEEHLKLIETGLNKIPPEDRHNAYYYFVKGLYAKQLGDFDHASRHLKHAISLVSNFKEAKRELNLVELQIKNHKKFDIFKADLKDVVGLLFKAKK